MLTMNLWPEAGLANSSKGIIHDIVYMEGEEPHKNLPHVVLVKFPNYRGPEWLKDHPHVVPIPARLSKAKIGGINRRRKMFPLKLAWALTVHKAQGMTIRKGLSADISEPEGNQIGRHYVALSRVTGLDKLRLLKVEKMLYENMNDLRRRKGRKGRLKTCWKTRQEHLEHLEELERFMQSSHKLKTQMV